MCVGGGEEEEDERGKTNLQKNHQLAAREKKIHHKR